MQMSLDRSGLLAVEQFQIQTMTYVNGGPDLRRANRIVRYKPIDPMAQPSIGEDPIPEYMNVIGMICSMCGLMMRIKYFSWAALFCSCVCFANTRSLDDAKQIVSSFMLSVSAVVMCYLQNPSPIIPPWITMM